MLYMIIYNLFNFLSSYSIFYYCNWVLGTYNDGITQALFYGLGNAPLGAWNFSLYPHLQKAWKKKRYDVWLFPGGHRLPDLLYSSHSPWHWSLQARQSKPLA